MTAPPREPTQEMLSVRVVHALCGEELSPCALGEVWRVMYDAAPAPSAEPPAQAAPDADAFEPDNKPAMKMREHASILRALSQHTMVNQAPIVVLVLNQAANDADKSADLIEHQARELAAARADAERWRRCIADGEFPKRHKGEWLHVCRTTGDILVMPTAADAIDAAIDAAKGAK